MTLRDAVEEALAAWMMFEDDGGRADYDRLVPKMTALRAALAQEVHAAACYASMGNGGDSTTAGTTARLRSSRESGPRD